MNNLRYLLWHLHPSSPPVWPLEFNIPEQALPGFKKNQSLRVVKAVKGDFNQALLQLHYYYYTITTKSQYRTGLNSKYSVDKQGLLAKVVEGEGVGGWKNTKRKQLG